MKQFLKFSFVIFYLLIPFSSAFALPEDPQLQVEEQILAQADVQEDQTVRIELSDGAFYEFDRTPNLDEMKRSLGLVLPEKIKQEILARGGSITETNPLEDFEGLTPERKIKFLEARLFFLRNAARILHTSRLAFGAGTLVNDAFSFVTNGVKKRFGGEVQENSNKGNGISKRGQAVVQAILQAIDYKLWSQAPLVIDSNEYGVSASIGILAESGIMKKGTGGAEEIGISLALNKTNRAFVFEIFHNSENFAHTKAAVSVIGIVGKAGIMMGRRSETDILLGSSFYPPAVPGYSSASSSFFSAGMSSSLGLPPPPLADILTYTNRFERNSLIRVTVSPLVKGYIRIEMGDFDHSSHLVALRFIDVWYAISEKVKRLGRRSCGAVFN